jgi:glutamate racemase
LAEKDVDTLILGCTHYPVLAPLINELYPEIKVTDGAKTLAAHIKTLSPAKDGHSGRIIMVTDLGAATESLKSRLVGDIPLMKVTLTP